MDIAINYMFLGRAIGHYSRLGYHYIEAPWLVSEQASDITRPPEAPQLSLPLLGGALVASAEQSFLQLDLDNRLPEGRFVACTPCFRPEPVPDRYRQTTFMKVELYQNVDVSEESMFMMLADAQDFMTLMTFEHTPPWKDEDAVPFLVREKTDQGWDLMLNGVEVGSYGVREHGELRWVYGTGLAEPRFSTVVNELSELSGS